MTAILPGFTVDALSLLCTATVLSAVAVPGKSPARRCGWACTLAGLFLVLVAVVALVTCVSHPERRWAMMAGGGVGVVFAGIAFALRFLNRAGAAAGGLFAASLVGLGGTVWAVPGATFFFLSSILSHLGRRRKAAAAARSEKGPIRDAAQVFANGGVAWGFLLAHALWPKPVFYVGFLGALAAAAADTWATELGTMARGQPRLVTTLERVPPGTSGAISRMGTLGALLGALSVALSAALSVAPATLLFSATLGGFLATLVDSLLGATIQAQYRHPDTGETSEVAAEGLRAHTLVRGWAWVNNDRVNWACTLAGAFLTIACFRLAGFAS